MIQTRKRIKTPSLAFLGAPTLAALCGVLAANAALPFGLLPFGVAAACLSFDRAALPVALAVGAAVGYALQGTVGIAYIAGILLALPLRYILTALARRASRRTVTLISTAVSLTFTHLLICSYNGFLTFDILTGLLSAAAGTLYAFFACLCLPAALKSETRLSGLTQTESAALLIVLCILLLPLSRFSIVGITPAHVPAAFGVLIFAVYGGAALGGMSGAIVGAVLSFASPSATHIIAAYAVGGILAGLVGRKGRLRAVTVFVLGVSVLSIYINGTLGALSTVCEASLACAIWVLLPEKASARLSRLLTLKTDADTGQADAMRAYLDHKLSTTAHQLDRISRSLVPVDRPPDTADLHAALDRASEPHCRRCIRSTACRIGRHFDTEQVFSRLSNTLSDRPVTAADLPDHFKERCPSWASLLDAANALGVTHRAAQLESFESERNRTVLSAQYASLSQLIGEMGEQVRSPLRFDAPLTRRIEEYFAAKHCGVRALLAYRDNHDGLYVRAVLTAKHAPEDRRTLSDISTLCGTNMTVLTSNPTAQGWQLVLGRREKFKLEIAAAQAPKQGERLCGDAYTRFRPAPYHQAIVLSDGMGSGVEAHRHAVLTGEVLESIMQSGFCAEKALRLLNSTLLLATDARTFSTVDLLDIDLFCGRVDLYKLGAADTVILRGGRSYTIPCSTLPVGILGDAEPGHRFFSLKDGDLLILHSDGVTLSDEALASLMNGVDLDDMCRECLDRCGDAGDDRTVILVRAKIR